MKHKTLALITGIIVIIGFNSALYPYQDNISLLRKPMDGNGGSLDRIEAVVERRIPSANGDIFIRDYLIESTGINQKCAVVILDLQELFRLSEFENTAKTLSDKAEVTVVSKETSEFTINQGNLRFTKKLSDLPRDSADVIVVKFLVGWDPDKPEESNKAINDTGMVLKERGVLFIHSNDNFAVYEKVNGQMIPKELAINMNQFNNISNKLGDTLLDLNKQHYFSQFNKSIINSCQPFRAVFGDLDIGFSNIVGKTKKWQLLIEEAEKNNKTLSNFIAEGIVNGLKNKGYEIRLDDNNYLHCSKMHNFLRRNKEGCNYSYDKCLESSKTSLELYQGFL